MIPFLDPINVLKFSDYLYLLEFSYFILWSIYVCNSLFIHSALNLNNDYICTLSTGIFIDIPLHAIEIKVNQYYQFYYVPRLLQNHYFHEIMISFN